MTLNFPSSSTSQVLESQLYAITPRSCSARLGTQGLVHTRPAVSQLSPILALGLVFGLLMLAGHISVVQCSLAGALESSAAACLTTVCRVSGGCTPRLLTIRHHSGSGEKVSRYLSSHPAVAPCGLPDAENTSSDQKAAGFVDSLTCR